MDSAQTVPTISVSSPRRPLRAEHSRILLSMQAGDSFTIPNDARLRTKVATAARYWDIPIVTRAVSDNEIRIWRAENKPIEPRQSAVTKKVPPPGKLTSAVDIAQLREAKAKSRRQNAGECTIQEVQLVNNERHTVTLLIVEKKP